MKIRKKKQTKQGISLIVLVITIIVMIILAAAIILSLSSNGIIDRANEALEKTDKAQVHTLANTIWMEAYLDGARTDKELYDAVREGLKENGINPEIYAIQISSSGVGKVEDAIWVQDGTTVTNTETGLKISVGDYIDYKSGVVGHTDSWQVLGAENGEILIVASENIEEDYTLGVTENNNLEQSKKAFIEGPSLLDAKCVKYGNGEKASGARSIDGEDVDRVAKYDITKFTGKTTMEYELGCTVEEALAGMTDDAEKAALRAQVELLKIADYGREVTFLWDAENIEYPKYSFDGGKTIAGSLITSHEEVFTWYDAEAKVWRSATNPAKAGRTLSKNEIITDDNNSSKIARVTNNMGAYPGTAMLEEGSPAYRLLIAKDAETLRYYWLASPYVGVDSSCAVFGLRAVYGGIVFGDYLVNSDGDAYDPGYGVRPVVTLKSDIQLELANDEVEDGGVSSEEGVTEKSWTIINK